MTVADRIVKRRKQLHLSQEDVAKRLGLSDRSSITKIEKSGNDITIKNIERLANALLCSREYLMGFEELSDQDILLRPLQIEIVSEISGMNDKQLKLLQAYIDILNQSED